MKYILLIIIGLIFIVGGVFLDRALMAELYKVLATMPESQLQFVAIDYNAYMFGKVLVIGGICMVVAAAYLYKTRNEVFVLTK